VLYVSHDRYFINKTATRILDLKAHTLVNYIGNYDYYMEKRDEFTKIYTDGLSGSDAVDEDTDLSTTKLDWKQQKEEQARARKRENDLKKTEEQITAAEKRAAEIDALLSDPAVYSDASKLIKLNNEKTELDAEMERLFGLWEELAEE